MIKEKAGETLFSSSYLKLLMINLNAFMLLLLAIFKNEMHLKRTTGSSKVLKGME